jgi:hypothetical protein
MKKLLLATLLSCLSFANPAKASVIVIDGDAPPVFAVTVDFGAHHVAIPLLRRADGGMIWAWAELARSASPPTNGPHTRAIPGLSPLGNSSRERYARSRPR